MRGEVYRLPAHRLTEPVGFLSIQEMQRVDEALALVLDL